MINYRKLLRIKSNDYNKGSEGPPDLEEAIRRFLGKGKKKESQDESGSIYSRNSGNQSNNDDQSSVPIKKYIIGAAVVGALIWGGTGFYVVQPAEQAAVMRFGKLVSVEGPGLHWHPRGVYSVDKQNVEALKTISLTREMLTSEENIVRVSFTVQYRIGNLENYLFGTTDPVFALQQALESSVRQVVGGNRLEEILTTNRTVITQQVKETMEELVKRYHAGLFISEVIMQPAQAPEEVRQAFDDVIQAREDRERSQNEAQSYANKVVPIAQGRAQRVLDEARAYSSRIVLEAEGNVARFNQLLPLYQSQPEILENQIYFETMEEIFRKNKLFIVDGDGAKNLFYGSDKIASPMTMGADVRGGNNE